MNSIFKQSKRVWFLVVVIIAISSVSLYVINQKSKVEDKFNSYCYEIYNMLILRENANINRYLNIMKKVTDKEIVTREELDFIERFRSWIFDYIGEMEEFYYECYHEGDFRNVYEYNHYFNLRVFISHKTPNMDEYEEVDKDEYRINEEWHEYLVDGVYFDQKILSLEKILSEFKEDNKDYLIKLEEDRGKDFVKDGKWYDLHKAIYNEFYNIELDNDIGSKAPKGIIIPRQVDYKEKRIGFDNNDRGYKVYDTEEGIIMVVGTLKNVKNLDVKSVNMDGKDINIVMNEEGSSNVSKPDGGYRGVRFKLRGLQPGDSQKFNFRVSNESGDEYKYVEVKD